MKKRSDRFFIVVLSFIITATITLATVVAVLSASVQSVSSSMAVTYHANNVSATLRASYQVAGSNNAINLVNTTNNTNYLKFYATEATTTGVLDGGLLNINSTNSFVLFTFAFTNDASAGAYDIKVTLADNSTKNNMAVYYSATGAEMSGSLSSKYSVLTSSSAYTSIPNALYIPAQTTGYFYLLIEIADLDYGAQYASYANAGVSWSLEHVDLIGGTGWTINSDHVVTAYNGSATEITIPSEATAINSGVFAENKSLTSVTIPNTITNIGDRAFYNCTNITSMNIRCLANTTIGAYTFFGVDVDAITIANRNILKLTHLAIGHYPQTYVGNALNTTLENLYSNNSASLVATNKSYTASILTTNSSSATQVYTRLSEYAYNGNKYVRLSSAVPYSINNGFSTGDSITNGATYWFKVEPISVMVMATTSSIDTTKLTVMSDFVLGGHRYHTSAVTWDNNPELRKFLNGGTINNTSVGFYAEALNDVGKVVQITINNPSAENLTDDTSGIQTSDYVWVPSYWELTQSSNGFSTSSGISPTRYRQSTDFAKATHTYGATNPNCLDNSYYWTRLSYSSNIFRINYTGDFYAASSFAANTGFLPCFALSL